MDDDTNGARPAPRRPARRGGGVAPGLVRIAAFLLGFVLVAGVVLRARLVDPELYLAALDEADAYERAYTQVLADPELAQLTERLIGDLGVPPGSSQQLRVLSTSTLRWTLPPARLRNGTEAVVVEILRYVRGESAELSAQIDIGDLAARILETVLARVAALLAEAAETVVTTLVDYEEAVAEFARELAGGRVPASVPVLGGTAFDADRLVDAILAALGPRADDRLQQQVRGAVLAGSQRDALVAAASALVVGHAQRIGAGLRDDPLGTRYLDLLDQLADRSGLGEGELVAGLNTIRRLQGWFGPPTAVVGVALMGWAAASLVHRNRRDPGRALRSLASCGLASGVAVGVAWLLVAALVDPPLGPADVAGSGGWHLPRGLRAVLGDVQAALAAGVVDIVRRLLVVPVAAAVVLAGASWLPQLVRLGARPLGVATGASTAAVVAAVWLVPATPGLAPDRACNGHVELCARPYDEVVHATTHNAMSSPDVVVFWPEHDHDLRRQLDSGVRALMIDTHYWTPLVSGAQLASPELELPPPLADQLAGLVADRREGRRGTYLCHSHCSLGAKPLVDGLRQVGRFLADNPDEVVTLIVQDAITRRATVEAFERAELVPLLHAQDPDEPWPTLGQLVDRGTRLVVFAEVQGGSPPWYHRAFEHIQDTPYLARSPEELGCEAHRGPPDAPLFLMNHWVQRLTPDRAVAAEVNRHDVIVDRARRCEAERGQLPSFVAVNFSNIGDLVAAVEALNGL
jgi:hypothetical protein